MPAQDRKFGLHSTLDMSGKVVPDQTFQKLQDNGDGTHSPVIAVAGTGAPADAPATDPAQAASAVALLKGIMGRLPALFGRQAASKSMPVVLASDVIPPNAVFFDDFGGSLTANGLAVQTSRDVGVAGGVMLGQTYFNGYFYADQVGMASLEWSDDGTNWFPLTTPQSTYIATPMIITAPVFGRYNRTKFVMGGTASTVCKVRSSFTGS